MRQTKNTLAFKITASLVVLLLVFSCIVSVIGYITVSNSIESNYTDYTRNVAKTAEMLIKPDQIDYYLAVKGKTEDYRTAAGYLQRLCEKMDVSMIYVIKLSDDVKTYQSVFDALNMNKEENKKFTPWEVGHQETTLEDYLEIYRDFAAGKQDYGKIVRTSNLGKATPHITTVISLKGRDGSFKGVLCVQMLMNDLVRVRTRYLTLVAVSMVLTAVLVCFFAVSALSKQFVMPIRKIKDEAKRFAEGSTKEKCKEDLKDISRIDEISSLAASITKMEEDTVEYIENLKYITSEEERISTELNIASQIQEGSVPSIFPAFPERKEFDVFAMMHPAKEVGGDFYDFFFTDETHLALVMADVSGKGVPAALMMMVTKILIKERSTIIGGKPSEILEFVNDRICANNQADMFVTVWLGILDIETGTLTAANAGHEDPIVCRNGKFELHKTKHGLVVGAMEDIRYTDHEIHLERGDKLFLYTDGVPEANNEKEELFTLERTVDALNLYAADTPEGVIKGIKKEVDTFVGYAPQFDDLTMLCLSYRGAATEETSLTLAAEKENLEEVLAFVDGTLEAMECNPRVQMQIDLCVEEMFVNIASYAYETPGGEATITMEAVDDSVKITFTDSGKPYNPLAKADPDTTLQAEQRQIGGLGIFLVKKNMDAVEYRYEGGKNIFSMEKKIK